MSGMTRADGTGTCCQAAVLSLPRTVRRQIFPANLAVIGGRADDRTMAALGLSMLMLQLLAAVGVAVTSAGNVARDCMAFTASCAWVPAWLMTVTPDRADAGGSVLRGAVTKS